MLQQTQAATVEQRYDEFLARFPSVRTLARAPVEAVCEAWSGLGYYRRARNLHRAAQTVVAEHGGKLPADVSQLKRLPGIGDYTAGAIASIAFGLPEPVVDTNVARVLSRIFAVDRAAGSAEGQRRLWGLAREVVGRNDAGEINQALMELGALVCTARRPDCQACSVKARCRARILGRPEQFPPGRKKPARTPLAVAFAWISTGNGLWLERRPLEGRWAGMWQLPGAEGAGARRRLSQSLGVDLGRPLATVRHALSHRTVTARTYLPRAKPRLRRHAGRRVYADPLSAPLSSLAKKSIEAVLLRLERQSK